MKEVFQEVVDNYLKPHFIELGMNASGDWLNSLEVRINGNRAEIWGADYTEYLVNGRPPGGRPPIAPLIRWVGNKFGLSGREAVSAAYAISNKIAEQGTEYYPQGTDLLEILNLPEVKSFIYNKFGQIMTGEITASFERVIKQLYA